MLLKSLIMRATLLWVVLPPVHAFAPSIRTQVESERTGAPTLISSLTVDSTPSSRFTEFTIRFMSSFCCFSCGFRMLVRCVGCVEWDY